MPSLTPRHTLYFVSFTAGPCHVKVEPFLFILRINVILDKVTSTNKYDDYFPEYCVIMSSFLTEDIPMEFSARHNSLKVYGG